MVRIEEKEGSRCVAKQGAEVVKEVINVPREDCNRFNLL
jgi:hypothetical protein